METQKREKKDRAQKTSSNGHAAAILASVTNPIFQKLETPSIPDPDRLDIITAKTPSIKLPTSHDKIDPIEFKKRQTQTRLARTILSHIANDSLGSLVKNLKLFITDNLPDKVTLRLILGNNITEEMLEEFLICSIVETLKRLQTKNGDRTGEERQVIQAVVNIRDNKGFDLRKIMYDVCNHFYTPIPAKYK